MLAQPRTEYGRAALDFVIGLRKHRGNIQAAAQAALADPRCPLQPAWRAWLLAAATGDPWPAPPRDGDELGVTFKCRACEDRAYIVRADKEGIRRALACPECPAGAAVKTGDTVQRVKESLYARHRAAQRQATMQSIADGSWDPRAPDPGED